MLPLSALRWKMAMKVNQSVEHGLQMQMAVDQDRQSGGRCNTNHQGWFSRMVWRRFTEANLLCS